jgi:hypothetical protein
VTSYIVDSAAIYIMDVKFRNTICPPQPQLSLHSRAALSSDSNGTQSYMYSREDPKRSLYCEMSVDNTIKVKQYTEVTTLVVRMPFQLGGGNDLTNKNPCLPSYIPSQSHWTWHSGTKVVASVQWVVL